MPLNEANGIERHAARGWVMLLRKLRWRATVWWYRVNTCSACCGVDEFCPRCETDSRGPR